MRRALLFFLVQAPAALLLTAVFSAAAFVAALVERTGRTTRLIGGAWSRVLLRLVHPVVPAEGRSAEGAEALAEEVRKVVAGGCRPVSSEGEAA